MNKLYIYDCATNKLRGSVAGAISLGNTPEDNCVVSSEAQRLGVMMLKGAAYTFYPNPTVGPYTLNGEQRTGSFSPQSNTLYMLAIGGAMLLVAHGSEGIMQSFGQIQADKWMIFDESRGEWCEPVSLSKIASLGDSVPDTAFCILCGLNDSYCLYRDLLALAKRMHPVRAAEAASSAPMPDPSRTRADILKGGPKEEARPKEDMPTIDEENGEYTCPVCWLKFDAGSVMSIASHPDLMGDDILGRDSMKRFWATRFNSRGQALDEKGVPCTDLACPHCRRKLPPNYLNTEEYIFSIVGAPSSGKSYYLASLVNGMRRSSVADCRLAWLDADPSGNTMLNDVVNRLFSSDTPEDAALTKTDLEGALYEEFYRHGRMAKLPKPFIYSIQKMGSRKSPCNLVFYDNAGEHFEPGRNSEDSPGAQHVAVANGIFFLFDPITSRPFKKLISGKNDPQLHTGHHLDQQEIILAETLNRIAGILNLRPGRKIKTPLAMVIGKCDLWEEFLDTPLVPMMHEGAISSKALEHNSATVRRFMEKLHPSLCSTADMISSNVRFFAVSQLGTSPVTFKDPITGVSKIGPDPNQLAPRRICDPTYWVLSQISQDFVAIR